MTRWLCHRKTSRVSRHFSGDPPVLSIVKPRIVLTCRWPEEVEDILRNRYDVVTVSDSTSLSAEAIIRRCAEHCSNVIAPTSGDRISADLIRQLPTSIRLIANYGAGIDNIDLVSAASRNISVSNTPDVVTECTADLTIGLMISACRQFYRAESILRNGEWQGLALTNYFGTRVSGKVLGIIGLGRIGRAVAKRAHSFNMQLVYHSPRKNSQFEKQFGATFAPNIDSLLRNADIVSLHCPLNEKTRNMIDARALSKMKQGAILVNSARGTLVNEKALIDALRSNHLAAAGLDVYEMEPNVCEELRKMKQVTLLPHIGTATRESRCEMGIRVIQNIETFFESGYACDSVV